MIPPDRCPDDAPGAREIGFRRHEHPHAAALLWGNLARGNAERPALHHDGGTLSYAALCAMAARAGNAMRRAGLAPGERVLLALDDTPAMPACFFGALRAGLVPVAVNTLAPPDLLRFYLEDTGARFAVVEETLREAAEAARAGTSLETLATAEALAALLAPESDALDAAPTQPDDMAFWLYSSGTTGRPKGIVHLQHDMAYTAMSYARHHLALAPQDICFSVPKIFFAYGLGNTLTFPFHVGASAVLLGGRPDPARIFDAIARHRPSVFFGLPTLYVALAHAPEARGAETSSLRLCISAAETLAEETASRWRELTGLDIVEGLGSTEALHIYLSNAKDARKPGSAGRRVPGYELRLLDAEGAREVADGEEGTLWVRGHSGAPGYWNRPEKTAETMRGAGWLFTGDRFLRDAEGFHFFRGRADDLIKVSGQWVHPMEVEQCLANHPAVREIAVLAQQLPDKRMSLVAHVVAADPAADEAVLAAELQAHAKRALLPYKYPRRVVFAEALPKTGTGKIDRQALRALSPG
jgi:benzoate-CoA ligase family protein